MNRPLWLSLALVVVGCAAGEDNTDVVVSQSTEPTCPSNSPDDAAKLPSEPTNAPRGESGGQNTGVPGGNPGSTKTPTADQPSDSNGSTAAGSAERGCAVAGTTTTSR